jgi:hypothetical protein
MKTRIRLMRVLVDVIDARRIERRRPALDTVHIITLAQQQFGQVRPVLPRYSRNQCNFRHEDSSRIDEMLLITINDCFARKRNNYFEASSARNKCCRTNLCRPSVELTRNHRFGAASQSLRSICFCGTSAAQLTAWRKTARSARQSNTPFVWRAVRLANTP